MLPFLPGYVLPSSPPERTLLINLPTRTVERSMRQEYALSQDLPPESDSPLNSEFRFNLPSSPKSIGRLPHRFKH